LRGQLLRLGTEVAEVEGMGLADAGQRGGGDEQRAQGDLGQMVEAISGDSHSWRHRALDKHAFTMAKFVPIKKSL
jgi:hypothetical protein